MKKTFLQKGLTYNREKVLTLFLSPVLISLIWFSAYFFCSGQAARIPEFKSFLIPVLWIFVFRYLKERKYTRLTISFYFLFILLMSADLINFDKSYAVNQVAYSLLSFTALFLCILLYQDVFRFSSNIASIVAFAVFYVLILLPVFYIFYRFNFNAFVTNDIVFAISQTNLNESYEFIKTNFSPLLTIFLLLSPGLLFFLFLRQAKEKRRRIERSLLIFMILILSVSAYLTREYNKLYDFICNSAEEYSRELSSFKEVQAKVSGRSIDFTANKKGNRECYFVIIGESLNRDHMGLYGYIRDTTPLLHDIMRGNNSILLSDAYSSHVHTNSVLSLALSETNQVNRKSFFKSLTLLNILKKADFETYWVTNQALYGLWDNVVSVIAHESDHLIPLNRTVGKQSRTVKMDGEIIIELRKLIRLESDRNRIFFIHLMGNHMDYCSRYPNDEYEFYREDLNKEDFGSVSDEKNVSQRINCYDNSVRYNDFVVSSLFNILQDHEGIRGAIYFSDHADDVFGGLGHNVSNFTFEMTRIPFMAWFSDQYIDKYNDKFSSLKENSDRLYSSDFIYDTLLGILNIDTEKYSPGFDLSSPQYSFSPDDARVIDGKQLFTDRANYHWWQKMNIDILQKNFQRNRVIPHRVNSKGKLKDIWMSGLRSFEIDVWFQKDILLAGHDKEHLGGYLEALLLTADLQEIGKIWLDLKNFSAENCSGFIEQLNLLDVKFNIKQRTIVESSTKLNIFKQLRDCGWHTSYYLPTEKILDLANKNQSGELRRVAEEINIQACSQNVAAISFDCKLYPFVEEFLIPLLSDDIIFHTWDLSINFYDNDLQSKLKDKSYFKNERVKTILLPYKSVFNL